MDRNPFSPPGSEFLTGAPPVPNSPSQDIFKRPAFGKMGGTAKRAPQSVPEPELQAEQYQAQAEEPEKLEEKVHLHDLKWAVEKGNFEQKTKVSVRGTLPDSHKNITRVIFTLSLQDEDGKAEALKTAEGHLKDGLAEVEFVLPSIKRKDGTPLSEATFLCSAKHRDSKPTANAPLQATTKTGKEDELVLEIEKGIQLHERDWIFRLKTTDGSFKSEVRAKDAASTKGSYKIRFEGLPVAGKFSLEILSGDGKLLEQVFQEKEFGAWNP